MFGTHFYHATMRKSVAVFGTLFNDISVVRKKADGSIVNQVRVPLAYGPKQKFLSRLDIRCSRLECVIPKKSRHHKYSNPLPKGSSALSTRWTQGRIGTWQKEQASEPIPEYNRPMGSPRLRGTRPFVLAACPWHPYPRTSR